MTGAFQANAFQTNAFQDGSTTSMPPALITITSTVYGIKLTDNLMPPAVSNGVSSVNSNFRVKLKETAKVTVLSNTTGVLSGIFNVYVSLNPDIINIISMVDGVHLEDIPVSLPNPEFTLLEETLNLYPQFFTKEIDSTHVKYHSTLSSEYLELQRQQYIVSLSNNVNRPLKIWKEQDSPYVYDMMYEVNLTDIQRVQFYADTGDGDVLLLQDSGILPLGTESFSGEYQTMDNVNIIPTQKYYIFVTDYHENELSKGYPENDTPQGDIYDHDPALDSIGVNNLTPRQKYPNVDEIPVTSYAQTYPPYFIDKTESDYWYEERLKTESNTYGKLELVATEIYKYLGIYPEVQGRWRQVCKMGTGNPTDQFCGDVMGTVNGNIPTPGCKHIQTENWNSAVFDVWVDITSIPANIAFSEPTEDVLQTIIDKSFSVAKKAYLQYTLIKSIEDSISVTDTVKGITGIGLEGEYVNISETQSLSGIVNMGIDSVSFNESTSISLNNRFYVSSMDFLLGNIDINNPVMITNEGTRVYGSLSTGKLVDKYGNRYIMR